MESSKDLSQQNGGETIGRSKFPTCVAFVESVFCATHVSNLKSHLHVTNGWSDLFLFLGDGGACERNRRSCLILSLPIL